ncbi:MAG: TssQ family T6SS-associated lipoprotein [Burkholderiales bacterium]
MTTVCTSDCAGLWPRVLAVALLAAGCAAPGDKASEGGPGASPAPAAAAAPGPAASDAVAPPPAPPAKGLAEQEFELGVKSYEDGDYKSAARHLQAAVNFGLPAGTERATAHKYLAFVNCTSGQPRVCRDEFRRAFAADPSFDLTPAEAGHPIWGPVFRAVKAETAPKAKGK